MNLMLNAIEAMKDTGGALTITARPNSEGQIIVSIRSKQQMERFCSGFRPR
jgi:hypothetical protein